MTTAITKESLAARIAELESGPRSLKEDYTLVAYKMLLAAMEAEPVAWTSEEAIEEVYCDETGMIGPKHLVGDVPLYRRAQQPVVLDAIDTNLIEALRLVQCMLDDYRERNYGDAQGWIRHINTHMSDYTEAHGDDAYSVLHNLITAAPQSPGSEPATVPDIDYSALRYENMEPCAICGKVSSHPEGWHYCHGKK